MADYTLSDDDVLKIVQKINDGLEEDSKLTGKQICEDILEIIGVPTHTRDWACGKVF